jgi:ribosomal protein L40E
MALETEGGKLYSKEAIPVCAWRTKKEIGMIHCQKCNQQNAPEAQKCSQCGVNLLPGAGIKERLGQLGCLVLVGILIPVLAFLIVPRLAVGNILDSLIGMGVIALSVVAGIVFILLGVSMAVGKTPAHDRYKRRAERHIDLDPHQAIADYGAAIDLAPEAIAFDLLSARARLYQKQGKVEESKSDWRRALENIDHRIAVSKEPDPNLQKQRSEIQKHLGMKD